MANKILFFILFCFSTCYAQQAADERLWIIDDWSGGLNSKVSNTSVPPSQSTVLENVRLNKEAKSVIKPDSLITYGNASTTESIIGMHRLYLKDGTKALLVNHANHIDKGVDSNGTFTTILNLSTSGHRMLWDTWHNMAIGTDGYNQPVKYDGTSSAATYLGTCLATILTSGTGPTGTFSYKVSYYTSNYNVSANQSSNAVVAAGKDVNLTMIPIGPDTFLGEDVLGRHVYRNENGGTTWKLLTNGNITDNVNTTLLDSDTDADITARPAFTPQYTYPIPKGRIPVIHQNRLWLGNNPDNPSYLHYSEDASPDFFLNDSYFEIRRDDGDQITFAKPLLGILTVAKDNSIQKVYTDGDDPSADWEISAPFSNIGCRSIYSAQVTPLGIIYQGNDGLYRFNGQNSVLVSDDVTPEIKDISESNIPNTWGVYHKNVYSLAYTSKTTGATTNDRVLLYDLLTNAYSVDLLDINAFTAFSSGTDWDVLYAGCSNNGTVWAYTVPTNELIHKRGSDFSGGTHNDTALGGSEDSPTMSLAWNCTIDMWLADLQGRNASISVINNITEFLPNATIDIPDLDGTYISPLMNISANTFDKAYWNVLIPPTGGNITFAIRANTTPATTNSTAWSSEYTTPGGSDISAVATGPVMQYRLSFNTLNTTASPELYKTSNYVVKITYKTEGSTGAGIFPMHVVSGWNDLGAPGYDKTLKKVYLFYDSNATGVLNVTFSNWEGDTDAFNIPLATYPTKYVEYFTNGAFRGEKFKVDLYSNDSGKLNLKKITTVYSVEPIR